jgi:hypothetical protein
VPSAAITARKAAKTGSYCLLILPVGILALYCQHRAMVGETQKQVSFSRAALSTCGRAKSKFLSVNIHPSLLKAVKLYLGKRLDVHWGIVKEA